MQRKIRKFTKLLREHPDVKAVSQFNEERYLTLVHI